MIDKEFLYCCKKCGTVVQFEELHPIPAGWLKVTEGILFYHLCPICAAEKIKSDKKEILL